MKESGDILGVTDKVKNKHDAKAVLRYILEELVRTFLFCFRSKRQDLMFDCVFFCCFENQFRFNSRSSITERKQQTCLRDVIAQTSRES